MDYTKRKDELQKDLTALRQQLAAAKDQKTALEQHIARIEGALALIAEMSAPVQSVEADKPQ